MKKIIFCSLLIFCSATTYCKTKVSDRYVMQPRQNDLLYFILPFEIQSTSKDGYNASLDITYITSNSDATINMSIYSKNSLTIDSLVFYCMEQPLSICNFQIFYIEKDKDKWVHRVSCPIAYNYVKHLYSSPNAFTLKVFSKTETPTYQHAASKWSGEQTWMNEILQLIDLNKTQQIVR